VQNTNNEDDLAYLDEILASSPRYQKIDLSSEGVGFVGYANAWGHLERGKLYVKIDDYVVGYPKWMYKMRFRSDGITRSGLLMILFPAS
jgi:hypothetical protein